MLHLIANDFHINKTSPSLFAAIANEKMLKRARRGIRAVDREAESGCRISRETLKMMSTFSGNWRRKNRSYLNDIQMRPLHSCSKVGPFAYLIRVSLVCANGTSDLALRANAG